MLAVNNEFFFKESPDAWQTKIQARIPLPFPLPWIAIALAIFGIGYAVSLFSGADDAGILALAIICTLIAAISNAVIFFERILDEVADKCTELIGGDSGEINKWLTDWYREIFWSKKNLIAGLVLGSVCAISGAGEITSFFHSAAGKGYVCGVSFFVTFLGGSMLWTMYGIGRFTASLGKDVEIRPSIFDSTTSSLRAVSSVIWKVSFTAAAVYALGISIYFFCPIERDPVMMAVVISSGLFVLLYFVIPQMNIHRVLVNLKRGKLKALVNQIERAFDKVTESPTPENINQLRDLFHLQDALNGKTAWSFGTKEVLVLLGSIFVPLLIFALKWWRGQVN